MKKYDGAAILVILVVSTFVIFMMADMFFSSFTAKPLTQPSMEFRYIVDEKPQCSTGDNKEDSLVSVDWKVVGYNREDGLFVPTKLLLTSNYKGGTSQIDSIPVNPSEEEILLANGIHPRALKAISKWER